MHFTIRTDYNSLAWLSSFKEPKGQIARWLEHLQEYNFEVAHHKGRNHSNADALSRLSVSGGEDAKTARILAALVEQVQQCETAASVQSDLC